MKTISRRRSIKLLSLMFLVRSVAAAQSASPKKNIPAIARVASGSVVSIVMSDRDGKPIAQGSGFLVTKYGHIVTNYHVIAEGSSAVVKLPDGTFHAVEGVVASDKARDVAVIKASGQSFRPITLGDSDRVQVGEEVVAIGNPLSLESTVSNGIVSGVRTVEDLGGKFLQITAPISPGSSGGPLFNMKGEVIGITTLYLKGGENLNFAIPINDAKLLLLNHPARLQNLPNEPESATTDTPQSTEGEGRQADSIARRYYQGLFDAGAFFDAFYVAGSKLKGAPRIQDYACFRDDLNSDTFFTFIARGYDENYAKAYDKWYALWPTSSSTSAEYATMHEAYNYMQGIQQTADYPYVRFYKSVEFNSFSPDTQKFLRGGARDMTARVYEKGVNVATDLYTDVENESGKAWWNSHESNRLTIEPKTMRYVMRHMKTGPPYISEAGACEKIASDPQTK